MTTASLRDQLHKQLEVLPDDLLQEIADFTAFVLARRKIPSPYLDWTVSQWQDFTMQQFLRETADDVEYVLEDAEEVYRR